MNFDFVNKRGSLDDIDLHNVEEVLFSSGDGALEQVGRRLLTEIRRLQHELADPQYMFACSRIHRFAILTRDAEIARLREERKKQGTKA